MEDQKNQVVIEDDAVEKEEGFEVEGLIPEEVEMATELGLVKEAEKEKKEENNEEKDGEHKEHEADDNKENSEEQEKEKEEIDTDPSDFDQMDKVFEKDEKKFHESYTSNAKALYFKQKIYKKQKQELSKENAELKKKLETLKDSSLSQKKIDKISKMLTDDVDSLTVEALQKVIDEKAEIEDVVTDNKDIIIRKIQERIAFADKIGNAQYKNFNELTKFAGEVFQQKPIYQKQFDSIIQNFDIDESEIVDFVADIAKLNKNYGKQNIDPVVKDKVDRVLKNSKKKISSAAVGGSGKRIISEDELTCAQAEKLTPNQFAKLSEKTQKRLLMGIDP